MSSALIAGRNLRAGYNGAAAIEGVSIEAAPGEMVLLAGANGAGKTTTVKALGGAIPLMAGTVELFGAETTAPLHRRIRAGLGVVTEARTITMGLTVRENLKLGRAAPDAVLEHFPELEARMNVKAGLTSGGEQQMLSLGRVLIARPKVILADEVSQGLAPIIVSRLITALRRAADEGVGVLLVEQHIRLALHVVDRAFIMRAGQVVGEYAGQELHQEESFIQSMYL